MPAASQIAWHGFLGVLANAPLLYCKRAIRLHRLRTDLRDADARRRTTLEQKLKLLKRRARPYADMLQPYLICTKMAQQADQEIARGAGLHQKRIRALASPRKPARPLKSLARESLRLIRHYWLQSLGDIVVSSIQGAFLFLVIDWQVGEYRLSRGRSDFSMMWFTAKETTILLMTALPLQTFAYFYHLKSVTRTPTRRIVDLMIMALPLCGLCFPILVTYTSPRYWGLGVFLITVVGLAMSGTLLFLFDNPWHMAAKTTLSLHDD